MEKMVGRLRKLGRKIIGIAGPSGSGKTVLAKKLSKKINAKIISLDDYWKYHGKKIPSRKQWKKWEHPSSTNFRKVLKKIKEIEKFPYIIVEGLYPFEKNKLKKLIDLKIYIDIPKNLIIKRRLDKFGEADNQKWYSENIVLKAYKRYGEPKKIYADLILNGEENLESNIKKILKRLK